MAEWSNRIQSCDFRNRFKLANKDQWLQCSSRGKNWKVEHVSQTSATATLTFNSITDFPKQNLHFHLLYHTRSIRTEGLIQDQISFFSGSLQDKIALYVQENSKMWAHWNIWCDICVNIFSKPGGFSVSRRIFYLKVTFAYPGHDPTLDFRTDASEIFLTARSEYFCLVWPCFIRWNRGQVYK